MSKSILNLNEEQAAIASRSEHYYSKCTEIKNRSNNTENNIDFCDGRQDKNDRIVVPMAYQGEVLSLVIFSPDGRYEIFENWVPDGAYLRIKGNSAIGGYTICADYLFISTITRMTSNTVFCALNETNILNVFAELTKNISEHKQISITINSLHDSLYITQVKAVCGSNYSADLS